MKKQMLRGILSSYYLIILILPVILGGAMVLSATHCYNIGISTDSVGYIAASRNILNGNGILTFDGTPLVTHPPLYPIMLAIFQVIFGIDAIISAKILNALLFGIIIYLGGLLMKNNIPSFTLVVFGTSAIVCSRPLFIVSQWAWSELLFITFVLSSFIFLAKYNKKVNVTYLTLCSVSVLLSFLTRYIGVTLILWGVILILTAKHNNLKQKIIHMTIFITITGIPMVLWIVRNFIISDTLFSYRPASQFTLPENVKLYSIGLFRWFFPDKIISDYLLLILICVLVAVFIITGAFLILKKLKTHLHDLYTIILFIFIYSLFLVITSSINEYDPIDDRLLSPIYIPFIILIFKIILISADNYKKFIPEDIVDTVLVIGLVIWFIFQIDFISSTSKNIRYKGQGYTNKVWGRSETISYLLKNKIPENTQLYSNSPDIVYILANRSSKKIPGRNAALAYTKQLSNLRGNWPEEENVKLIWFNRIVKEYLLSLQELNEIATIDTIISLKDGSVYSVTRAK